MPTFRNLLVVTALLMSIGSHAAAAQADEDGKIRYRKLNSMTESEAWSQSQPVSIKRLIEVYFRKRPEGQSLEAYYEEVAAFLKVLGESPTIRLTGLISQRHTPEQPPEYKEIFGQSKPISHVIICQPTREPIIYDGLLPGRYHVSVDGEWTVTVLYPGPISDLNAGDQVEVVAVPIGPIQGDFMFYGKAIRVLKKLDPFEKPKPLVSQNPQVVLGE